MVADHGGLYFMFPALASNFELPGSDTGIVEAQYIFSRTLVNLFAFSFILV